MKKVLLILHSAATMIAAAIIMWKFVFPLIGGVIGKIFELLGRLFGALTVYR